MALSLITNAVAQRAMMSCALKDRYAACIVVCWHGAKAEARAVIAAAMRGTATDRCDRRQKTDGGD